MNRIFRFDALFAGGRWIDAAMVEVDQQGCVRQIFEDRGTTGNVQRVDGYAIPGFCNGHSHAFQFAMAGMTECLSRNHAEDDFWSWREAMYGLAQQVSVDDVQVIAAAAYSSMLRAGYTGVVEFNYLHHRPDGSPLPEGMNFCRAMIAAAEEVGIDMVMVPILYQTGDIGESANQRQQRFIYGQVADYLAMVDELRLEFKSTPGVAIGVGGHSIRAVPRDSMREIVAAAKAWNCQFHLHISEQTHEVDSAMRNYQKPPISWFLENFGGDASTYLVHATHAQPQELQAMISHGINVVLCPTTEGDLGDGFFPFKDFAEGGGAWLIGSDSHVVIDPWVELRQQDFVERLRLRKRNITCQPGEFGGERLLAAIAQGERKIRRDLRLGLEVGQRFDAIVYDKNHSSVVGLPLANRLSGLIYSGGRDGLVGWFKGKTFHRLVDQTLVHERRIAAFGALRQSLWS